MAVYVGRAGTPFAVSAVLAVVFVGMTLFSPVWGALADATGRRRAVVVASGLLSTLAALPLTIVGAAGPSVTLPVGTLDGVWIPIGLRGLYASLSAGFVPVMLSIVSARGGDDGRGQSVGFFESARGVGNSAGELTAGALLGLVAPPSLYLVVAGLSLGSTLAVVVVTDPTPAPDRTASARELVGDVRQRLVPSAGDQAYLRRNGLRWLYVALAMRVVTVLGTMSLMPVFLTGPVGLSEFAMGLLLAISPACKTVCSYLFGRVADAVGRKPLVAGGMVGGGLFPIVAVLSPVADDPTLRAGVVAAAMVINAVGLSAMRVGALAFVGDVAPADRKSELMGLRSTAMGVGGAVGIPLFGAAATLAGTRTAFAAGSLFAFAAAGVAAVGLVEPASDDDSASGLAAD